MVLVDIKRKIREIIADVLEIEIGIINDEADLEKDLGCGIGERLVILNRIEMPVRSIFVMLILKILQRLASYLRWHQRKLV